MFDSVRKDDFWTSFPTLGAIIPTWLMIYGCFYYCFNFGEPFSGTWLLFKIFLEYYWVFSYHYKLFNHIFWLMTHSDWMTGCRQLLQYVYIWRCGDAAHTPDDRWEDPNTVLINDFSGKWDAGENLVVLTLPFQLPHTRDATLCLCISLCAPSLQHRIDYM